MNSDSFHDNLVFTAVFSMLIQPGWKALECDCITIRSIYLSLLRELLFHRFPFTFQFVFACTFTSIFLYESHIQFIIKFRFISCLCPGIAQFNYCYLSSPTARSWHFFTLRYFEASLFSFPMFRMIIWWIYYHFLSFLFAVIIHLLNIDSYHSAHLLAQDLLLLHLEMDFNSFIF